MVVNLTVDNLFDEDDNDLSAGDVSLRDALKAIDDGGTIDFSNSLANGTITLDAALGTLLVDKSVTINGLGADQLTIDADGNSGVFRVNDGDENLSSTVTINGLTITGGSIVEEEERLTAGGITNDENLTLSNSTISNNTSAGYGGGIFNDGTTNINNSTISGNSGDVAGGIYESNGTSNISNSTISGNTSRFIGGLSLETANISNTTISGNTGGFIGGLRVFSTVMINSTISNNTANNDEDFGAGGVVFSGGTGNIPSTIASTIIAGNTTDNKEDIEGGNFISNGNNLIGNPGNATGFTDGINGDIVGTAAAPIDPLLGSLQDNGGSTETQALLPGSPAINAGSNPEGLTTDQRGEDRVQQGTTDIGAFESDLLPNNSPDAVDDTVITDEDNALSGSVFANNRNGADSDPEGDTLSVTEVNGTAADVNNQVTLASGALLTLNSEGTFNYDPNGQFESLNDGETGSDSFTYTIDDGNGATDTATVNVTINGVTDTTPPNKIKGTRKSDKLVGTPERDLITGGNGDDTIKGRGDDDTIEGGRGGDIIRGGKGDDVLAADQVDRFTDFDGKTSELRGGNGNDTIFGGSKDDLIGGGKDNDVLFGKRGDDLIRGASGDDTLNGGLGNDTLRGQRGIDTADYSDLTFNGVFGRVAGLDVNLSQNSAQHSSNNNALTWSDTLTTIENVIGTSRNDRFIGNGQDNVFDGKGEVNRNDRQTTFTDVDGGDYQVIADVVEYSGNKAEFTILGSSDNFTVNGSGIGTDTLIDIEFLKFDDALVAVDNSLFA